MRCVKAISYNNLWKILIDKNMNKGDLCNKVQISKGTMAKKTNNEPVTFTVIEKICDVLQCDIEDVVQIANINKARGLIDMSEALLDKKFEYWQNQLLDLGKRNRMINYRENKRATL